MQKESLINVKYSSEKIIHTSLFIYLFLLIFPHTTTLREISFWIAAICCVLLRLRKSEPFIPLNPIVISLSIFIGIAFISSVIGMEPLENLKRFKGELLIPFLLFLITATEYKTLQKAKSLFIAPVIAFAAYTVLVIGESFNYGFVYFWDRATRQNLWLDGYGQIGITIFPITLGMFLLNKDKWFKYSFLFFGIIELGILMAYRSFTVSLSAVSVLLLWVVFVRPRKYRLWMTIFISLFLFITGLLLYSHRDHPAVKEYRTKLEKIADIPGEFMSEGGFSNRMPAWKAAIDIIKDKPILGYGWGIKKFKELVYQEKFLERWRESKPSVYEFYTVTVKDTFFPPHNLFLEIVVQSGLLGLVAFIIFIGIYLFSLIKETLRRSSETDNNFSVILIGGTFLSFMIMNLMNDELGNVSGKILFVVLGASAAWMKNKPH